MHVSRESAEGAIFTSSRPVLSEAAHFDCAWAEVKGSVTTGQSGGTGRVSPEVPAFCPPPFSHHRCKCQHSGKGGQPLGVMKTALT